MAGISTLNGPFSRMYFLYCAFALKTSLNVATPSVENTQNVENAQNVRVTRASCSGWIVFVLSYMSY